MPPWELIAGPAAATIVLVYIVKVLYDRYSKLDDQMHTDKDAIITRLIAERDLALSGWREQTALTNAAVAAFADERRDRNARHRGTEDR